MSLDGSEVLWEKVMLISPDGAEGHTVTVWCMFMYYLCKIQQEMKDLV